MPTETHFKIGDYNAICDRCGFEHKASELKEEWTGLMVCVDCWEPRHPQEFVRGVKEDITVPWSRPESDADTNTTDIEGNSIVTKNTIELVGDTSKTLVVGTHSVIQEWGTDLTGNRTATLSSTNAINGSRFTIYRTGGGAFTLNVGGLYTIPASLKELVVVEYSNGWRLVSHTPLGL